MEKRKRIGTIALGAVLCLLFGAPSFAVVVTPGDMVTLDYAPFTTGGAYQATISGSIIWSTFCIEKTETFSAGSTYKVDSVGFYAIGGGAGIADPPGTTPTASGGTGDPISYQTAFLYNAFLNNPGALEDYDGSVAKQKSLQTAFWYLENEISDSDPLYGDALAQAYVAYALTYNSTDSFGVQVFNPVTLNSDGSLRKMNQSMLYQNLAVPEAEALLLFGTGLGSLVWYRRARRMR